MPTVSTILTTVHRILTHPDLFVSPWWGVLYCTHCMYNVWVLLHSWMWFKTNVCVWCRSTVEAKYPDLHGTVFVLTLPWFIYSINELYELPDDVKQTQRCQINGSLRGWCRAGLQFGLATRRTRSHLHPWGADVQVSGDKRPKVSLKSGLYFYIWRVINKKMQFLLINSIQHHPVMAHTFFFHCPTYKVKFRSFSGPH